MKKLLCRIICIALFIFLVLPVIHAANTIPELQLKDFEIGGFRLTQPISEIVAKLGEPNKIEYDQNLKYKKYFYSNMTIGFYISDNKLDLIEVKDPKLKTFRGIGVGEKKEKVFEKYGKVRLWGGNQYLYQLWHSSYEWGEYTLSFVIKDGIVTRIEIYFAAD